MPTTGKIFDRLKGSIPKYFKRYCSAKPVPKSSKTDGIFVFLAIKSKMYENTTTMLRKISIEYVFKCCEC